jgi:drug/metabolite transporter (DMT)-like permease
MSGSRGTPQMTYTAPSARTWAALGTVYVVWGSTYLAIRVAIETLPPFLMAATRFLVAGSLLFAFSARRGGHARDRIGPAQWRAAAIVGGALLLGGNGGVVWAEHRIASGAAALLVAMLPLWMAILDRVCFGRRLSRRGVLGLGLGFCGLVLLVGHDGGRVDSGGVDPLGAAVCMLASFSWAAGSVYARTASLPHRPLVATAMEMLAGGFLLTLVGLAAGEAGRVRLDAFSTRSVLALAYLIVFGSLLAFSAYVWLLHRAPLPLVATYAYVNPVVAVVLGWLLLDEPITPRMIVAGSIIVVAVALIAGAAPPPVEEDEPEAQRAAAG